MKIMLGNLQRNQIYNLKLYIEVIKNLEKMLQDIKEVKHFNLLIYLFLFLLLLSDTYTYITNY